MAKKKRQGEVRNVPLKDIKQAPIRHKQGLTPVQERLARAIFSKVGHFVYPTFEQWELGFMRDTHPWREILIWETIARSFDLCAAKHPDFTNNEQVVGMICAISSGQVSENETALEKELRALYLEARKKLWCPILEGTFDFPSDAAPVLQYEDVIEEIDGGIYPNLQGPEDPRSMLAAADIIVGMDSTSGKQFCFYGRDDLEDDGRIPWGFKTLVIRLDADNEKKHELEKICVVVEAIKGHHDLG